MRIHLWLGGLAALLVVAGFFWLAGGMIGFVLWGLAIVCLIGSILAYRARKKALQIPREAHPPRFPG